MNIKKYPDGSSYVIADTELIGKMNYEFTHFINSYEDLWHLNQRVDAFYNLNKQKPTVIIPCLIDVQADRRFSTDQSSGLKLVCKFLNKMKANFEIFHPHNPEVVEALIDNVKIINNTEFIKHVLYNTLALGAGFPDIDKLNNIILMSTDAGGFKPLIKLADELNWKGETFSASKSRSWKDNKSILTQQIDKEDFGGKDILIVDDILIGGSTMINLAKILKKKNVGKIYGACSHTTIKNPRKEIEDLFDLFFTTNSKFEQIDYSLSPEKFKVISLF